MEKLEGQRLRDSLRDLLGVFDKACRENNIRYFLAYGTLLGAIRHHGFIPWDDDIDVFVPDKDYFRLLELPFFATGRFRIQSPFSDNLGHKYWGPYAKLFDMDTVLIQDPDTLKIPYHLYIDIFPLTLVSSSAASSKRLFNRVKRYMRFHCLTELSYYKLRWKECPKKAIWLMLAFCSKLLGKKHFLFKAQRLLEKNNKQGPRSYVAYLDPFPKFGTMVLETDLIPTEVCFEGISVFAPRNYDEILRHCYGDYMTLPPENERKTHHDFIAWTK